MSADAPVDLVQNQDAFKLLAPLYVGITLYFVKIVIEKYFAWKTDKREFKECFIDFLVEMKYMKDNVQIIASAEAIKETKILICQEGTRGYVSGVINQKIYDNMYLHRHKFKLEDLEKLNQLMEQAQMFHAYYEKLGSENFRELSKARKDNILNELHNIGKELLELLTQFLDLDFTQRFVKDNNLTVMDWR